MIPKHAGPLLLTPYPAHTLMGTVNLAIQVSRLQGRAIAFRFHDRMHRVEPCDTHYTAQKRAAIIAGHGDASA